MKKSITIVAGLLVAAAAVFADPVIKYETNGTQTKIENFSNKKVICTDNVRFINETESKICFSVYGKKSESSDREFLCSVEVAGKDTELKSPSKKMKKYKYVELVCENGEAEVAKITCEHDDMYFYIKNFKENSVEAAVLDDTPVVEEAAAVEETTAINE